jgi:cytochrome c-type biogenesis protein CcmH
MSHVRPKSMLAICLITCFIFITTAGQSVAVLPDEVLKDAALEARARSISKDLRCLVCQNQSIDDSNAPLAKDLRVIVRERLTAGDSNEQAVNYIVARYGNYVLLKPPFQQDTALLWLAPFLVLLAALGVTAGYLRKRSFTETGIPIPLNEEDLASITFQSKDS